MNELDINIITYKICYVVHFLLHILTFELHLVIKYTGCPNPNWGSTNTTLTHNIKTI
ncbi:hypothetical protein YYC_04829 [Plasmodium yoelii 17X]|uniref:Uncharacterized protein n=2 Tax=Plasmodium yoelii TaxID=5861 RepID=Q7RKC6_PLAYO|nr:hypothetical protein [Plasmodium yoelii yoelii]ETB57321.1 hypothetical protein YYC_04829 [Plasmodium yoelii 17X]